MRYVVAVVIGVVAGALGGAWSARGEMRDLRAEAGRFKYERDRARKQKGAADLAMLARAARHERPCPPCPPCEDPRAAAVAPAPAEPPVASAPDAGTAAPPTAGLDPRAHLERFAAEANLDAVQRAEIARVTADFQRQLEEALGEALARVAVAEATQRTPRPREIAEVADRLLHTYLGADDRLRALLDARQLEALEESDFDLVTQLDFAALENRARQAAPAAPPPASP